MFLFRYYIVHYNTSFFVSQGIKSRSGLNATSNRNLQNNLYLPHVRTFLCKSSIVYQSIALWNALPVELKNCHLSKVLNIIFFIFYY